MGAVGFDLNAACSGFLFAYNTAQAYIASGIYRTILIIGSESLSRIVDWTDRGTCILFGDGAGAVLLQAKEGKSYQPVSHSDGRGDVYKRQSVYKETDEFGASSEAGRESGGALK